MLGPFSPLITKIRLSTSASTVDSTQTSPVLTATGTVLAQAAVIGFNLSASQVSSNIVLTWN